MTKRKEYRDMRNFLGRIGKGIKKLTLKVSDFVYYDIWYHGIRSSYYTVRAYLRTNTNRKYWGVVKEALRGYPWDYCFLYSLEKAKLEEMLRYHKKSNIICEEQREQIIRTLNLAIRMLDIIENETDLYHFEGEEKWIPIEGTDLHRYDRGTLEYFCDVKVNMRNIDRFVQKEYQRMYELHNHELYLLKARYLYHKIRFYYTEYWWD